MRQHFFDMALSTESDDTSQLYYRSDKFANKDGFLYTQTAGSSVSFDTCFNMVPSGKIIRYTDAEEISFDIDADGDYKLEIYSSDGTREKLLTVGNTIKIKELPENSVYVYPKITAYGSLLIKRISVYCEIAKVCRINPVLIMCTFRREEYAVTNANLISRCEGLDVILVDNGKTIKKEQLSPGVELIYNENTGGSGGFSRGMQAAAEKNKYSHFVVMDDDVRIDTVSLYKLFGFLRMLKAEYSKLCVSGAMLFSDRPTIQFESGGFFSADGQQKGYGYSYDLTDARILALNEQQKEINYGGWWFMCMPMSYVYDGNYPLPFFIKYDDVEYALRCRLNIVTLNGVSVWHEPFEWKYNSSSEYYNMRNYLHLRSLIDKNFTKRQAKKIMQKQRYEKLCRQQYKMAEAVKRGYLDYLKGIDYLKNTDAEANHKNICKLNYVMLSEKELSEKYNVKLSEEKYLESQKITYKRYKRMLMYGLLVPKIFCKKDYVVTDSFFDRKEMYFRYKVAVHYDRHSNKGYITKKGFIKYKSKDGTDYYE